jgi:hypothetical protein
MFLKIGRSREKAVPVAGPANDEEVTEQKIQKVGSLEELVARRTQDLKEAKEQLNQLHMEELPAIDEKEAKAAALFTQPNPPPGDPLSLKKEEEVVKGLDLKAILKVDMAVKVPEASVAPKAEPKAEAEKKPEAKAKDDSLAGLFDHEDENINPLAGLIKSLPDVSARELLNEATEVSEIIREMRRR